MNYLERIDAGAIKRLVCGRESGGKGRVDGDQGERNR